MDKPFNKKDAFIYVTQSNGIGRKVFTEDGHSYPDRIRHFLQLMNGTGFWAWSLWRVPADPSALGDAPFSEEYIQCVGSSTAMTLEVRTLDPDDGVTPYRFVIGKPGDYDRKPGASIAFENGKQQVAVYPSEIFTADEAAAIVYTYFETKGITRFFNLRGIDESIKPITTRKDLSPASEDDFVDSVTVKYINIAICAYLGKGQAAHPQQDEAALRKLVGNHKRAADSLIAKVKTIVDGCLSVEVDWSTHSLTEGGDEARRVMAARYPELNDDALDALRWLFTYSWR